MGDPPTKPAPLIVLPEVGPYADPERVATPAPTPAPASPGGCPNRTGVGGGVGGVDVTSMHVPDPGDPQARLSFIQKNPWVLAGAIAALGGGVGSTVSTVATSPETDAKLAALDKNLDRIETHLLELQRQTLTQVQTGHAKMLKLQQAKATLSVIQDREGFVCRRKNPSENRVAARNRLENLTREW